MIQKKSNDPDVTAAAAQATTIVKELLDSLPPAETFDYGGHKLRLGEYEVCTDCTMPIAEAQQAGRALARRVDTVTNPTVKEHVELAAELLRLEAAAAEIRAQLHNGHGSEPILNELLGFMYHRNIHDHYEHNHEARKA